MTGYIHSYTHERDGESESGFPVCTCGRSFEGTDEFNAHIEFKEFEEMVLEEIEELAGEEEAAIAEYLVNDGHSMGFWNDPQTKEVDWDEEGAKKIAKRAMEAKNDNFPEEDRQYILDKAGVA